MLLFQGRTEVGGIMSTGSVSKLHWTVVVAAVAGSVVFVWVAVFSFTDAMIGNGGGAGNVLRVALGLLALFAGVLLLVLGAYFWRLTRERSHRELA
jgi:hypothetical protein